MGSQAQKGLPDGLPAPLSVAWPRRRAASIQPGPPAPGLGTLALGVLAGARPLSLTDTAEGGMSQQSFGLQVTRGSNNQNPFLPQKEQEAVDGGSTPWARLCCSPGLLKVGHIQGRKREKGGTPIHQPFLQEGRVFLEEALNVLLADWVMTVPRPQFSVPMEVGGQPSGSAPHFPPRPAGCSGPETTGALTEMGCQQDRAQAQDDQVRVQCSVPASQCPSSASVSGELRPR